jgi:hypothetical protein
MDTYSNSTVEKKGNIIELYGREKIILFELYGREKGYLFELYGREKRKHNRTLR